MKNSRSPVTTLLFDMDNTLFDLVGAQEASCREVCRHFGHDDGNALYEYFLRPTRGFEAHENIEDYMMDHKIPDKGQYGAACRIYETVKLQSIVAYDGVMETIDELSGKGYRMAIVTDAYSKDATLRLEKINLLPFFDCLIAFDMTGKKKPATDSFRMALKTLGAGIQESLTIGDSPRRDIEPCHGMGIRTVYARYGDRLSDDRSDGGADFTIDSIRELPGILDNLR
jgi:putative hydrolase of the HAD superfamily